MRSISSRAPTRGKQPTHFQDYPKARGYDGPNPWEDWANSADYRVTASVVEIAAQAERETEKGIFIVFRDGADVAAAEADGSSGT